MRALLIACLFCAPLLASEPLEVLVERLGHEEFEVREDASGALVDDFPGDNVEKYLDLAERYKSRLEVSMRLRRAAKELFLRKVLPARAEYRRIMGVIGFSYSTQYNGYTVYKEGVPRENKYYPNYKSKPMGIRVDSVWMCGPADGKLRKWDVIVRVDGKSYKDFISPALAKHGPVEAGREYELTIRRYKEIEKIEKRGRGEILFREDAYELLTIKVVAGTKEFLKTKDEGQLRRLEARLWEELLSAREIRRIRTKAKEMSLKKLLSARELERIRTKVKEMSLQKLLSARELERIRTKIDLPLSREDALSLIQEISKALRKAGDASFSSSSSSGSARQ